MTDKLPGLLHDLPAFLGGHMRLSVAALAVGLAVSLPLGILVSRRTKLAELALGVAGIIQTVPSLALLALMVPLLHQIGFLPAFVALTLYSILPILANTILGIRGIDPALTEAARGLGMSDRQMLFRVQLPLAAPVILGGIRTATVLTVGTAVLAAPVGERTLGTYIFEGLETRSYAATVFGCVLAALLAVLMDQLIRLLELAAQRRSRALAWTGTAGLLLVVLGGLYQPISQAVAWGRDREAAGEKVVIASGPFTEQHILSDVLAGTLRNAGFRPDQRKGMGETIQFNALAQGSADCYVDYSGNVWALQMKRTDNADAATTLQGVTDYLRDEHGILCLGSLGFENAYALAMRRDRAARLGIHSLADLARYTRNPGRPVKKLKIGGDNQIFHRAEWHSLKKVYGLNEDAIETRGMDPTLMYEAVAKGDRDLITAYTSDGRIAAYDLEILADPKRVFPPYDAILLVSPKAAECPGLVDALRSLVGKIELEMMQTANRRVDVDGRPVHEAADDLLQKIGERGVSTPR